MCFFSWVPCPWAVVAIVFPVVYVFASCSCCPRGVSFEIALSRDGGLDGNHRGNWDMFLTKCGYNRISPFVIPGIYILCPNFIYQI